MRNDHSRSSPAFAGAADDLQGAAKALCAKLETSGSCDPLAGRCGVPNFGNELEDLKAALAGRPVAIGLDLSSKPDRTAVTAIIKGGPMRRRLVIVESPFAGHVPRNIAYAKRAVADCLERGEAPIASHLLFTQPGILDDTVPEDRELGIEAGLSWYRVAQGCVVYVDHGISGGMAAGIQSAQMFGVPVEYRRLLSHVPAPGVYSEDQLSRWSDLPLEGL